MADKNDPMNQVRPVAAEKVEKAVDKAVDYLKSNPGASPEALEQGGSQTTGDGGTGSDCIP